MPRQTRSNVREKVLALREKYPAMEPPVIAARLGVTLQRVHQALKEAQDQRASTRSSQAG